MEGYVIDMSLYLPLPLHHDTTIATIDYSYSNFTGSCTTCIGSGIHLQISLDIQHYHQISLVALSLLPLLEVPMHLRYGVPRRTLLHMAG